MNKHLIAILVISSIFTYSLWHPIKETFGISIFYIGNAICAFISSLIIWREYKKYAFSFILLGITANNLLDELIFDNTKFGLNEATFAFILVITTYLRCKDARKIKIPKR